MEKQNIAIIVLSTALVAALVVVIIAFSYNASVQSKSESQIADLQTQLQAANLNINSSASIFDARFHDLLQGHTYLLIDTARRSLANSSASYTATLSALQNNINAVGTLLTPIYGVNASLLVNLWNQKANIFINYSNSLKNNDPKAMTYYNAAVAAYVPQVVNFWTSTKNPYPVLDQAVATQLTSTHLTDVKAAIDAWYAGNYNLYYSNVDLANTEIGVYADVIAQSIIQQNPQDFQ
jgi:hypothetical protein